ncbi:MAG: hypothetical protein WC393_04095 [Candidatus Nanoarchaeia archaeon]|jgi:hypothetical protein
MKEENQSKKLFNLVLYELEKYCSNVANHPMISHDCHYDALRTKSAPLHRAVHWYLLDNDLVYQAKCLRLDVEKNEYANMWKLKGFDKKNACEKIVEKYGEYLSLFAKDFDEMFFTIQCDLEKDLRCIGLDKELDEKFESLNKKYYDCAELSASEYNKFLLAKYAELILNK